MAKFDKNAFKKNNNKLFLASGFVGLFGLASLICGFACGNGVDLSFGSKGNDPCNYYGTYYQETENATYRMYEIYKDRIMYTYGGNLGCFGNADTTITCYYDYVTADKISDFTTPAIEDKDAIFMYTNSSQTEAILLYVFSSDPENYTFKTEDTEGIISKEEKSFRTENGYFENESIGTYYNYQHGVKFILKEDNDIEFTLGEGRDPSEGKYANVSREYALKKFNNNPSAVPDFDRIIMYRRGWYGNSFTLMGIKGNNIYFPAEFSDGRSEIITLSKLL